MCFPGITCSLSCATWAGNRQDELGLKCIIAAWDCHILKNVCCWRPRSLKKARGQTDYLQASICPWDVLVTAMHTQVWTISKNRRNLSPVMKTDFNWNRTSSIEDLNIVCNPECTCSYGNGILHKWFKKEQTNRNTWPASLATVAASLSAQRGHWCFIDEPDSGAEKQSRET